MNVLETFDSDGVIERHVGRVRSDRTPHFHGAGVVVSFLTVKNSVCCILRWCFAMCCRFAEVCQETCIPTVSD